jgi:outer membrane protein OmpA-like peptidoglycan-associated protein
LSRQVGSARRQESRWGVLLCVALWAPAAFGAPECSPELAKSLVDPEVLRALKHQCGEDDKTFAAAVATLNSLPPPAGPRIGLRQPPSQAGSVLRVVLESEVYFDLLESYPVNLGLRRLEELVQRMGDGFRIERVEVTGVADRNEVQLPGLRLAEQRAAFVGSYFVNAGLAPGVVWTASRRAVHADTPEGRARDRAAAIRVLMLRERRDGP